MNTASGWRCMSATPPRFASSFSSSAEELDPLLRREQVELTLVLEPAQLVQAVDPVEIVRQFVSSPPSQRWFTYGMPTRFA